MQPGPSCVLSPSRAHARVCRKPPPPPTTNMALSLARRAAQHCSSTAAARPTAVRRMISTSVRAEAGHINPGVKKDIEKVVDTLKVEDLPKKAVICRCWRSEKFPFCDGAHAKHNAATGDNVGPLIIEKAQ